jgi:rod shape-determining protein MreD
MRRDGTRWIRFALLAAVAIVAAVRWPPTLTSLGLAPFWPFLPVLVLGLRGRTRPAVFLSWMTGLAVDALSLSPLGLNAFLFGVAALLLVRVRGHLFSAHPLTQTILGGVLTLLVTIALLVRLEIAEPDLDLPGRLPPALLLSLITGAVFPLLAWVDERIGLTTGFREGERRV